MSTSKCNGNCFIKKNAKSFVNSGLFFPIMIYYILKMFDLGNKSYGKANFFFGHNFVIFLPREKIYAKTGKIKLTGVF